MTQKILLAEDDNDMRRFLVKALEKAGYKVSSFDNGASAYDRLREEPFSLLLTDIVMPEMDGIELARRATELDPGFSTAFAARSYTSFQDVIMGYVPDPQAALQWATINYNSAREPDDLALLTQSRHAVALLNGGSE